MLNSASWVTRWGQRFFANEPQLGSIAPHWLITDFIPWLIGPPWRERVWKRLTYNLTISYIFFYRLSANKVLCTVDHLGAHLCPSKIPPTTSHELDLIPSAPTQPILPVGLNLRYMWVSTHTQTHKHACVHTQVCILSCYLHLHVPPYFLHHLACLWSSYPPQHTAPCEWSQAKILHSSNCYSLLEQNPKILKPKNGPRRALHMSLHSMCRWLSPK